MNLTEAEADALARRILAASDAAASIAPITDERPDFDLDDAYRVAARILECRIARGERPVGWKIGFTNRTIWDEYAVYAPIWGPIYAGTVTGTQRPDIPVACGLERLVEPRIEPEIVFRLKAPPQPGMDEQDLVSCIDAVAHGFEIVQSLFPGWRFRAPDTVAAFGLHGRLCHGPFVPVAGDPDRSRWAAMLSDFTIALDRDGVEIDRGVAANVLGGPLSALRHFARGLAERPYGGGLKAGDLVTTGTITRAFPVQPGERWATRITGLPVPNLAIDFR